MKFMKIPNLAVVSLTIVFLVVGLVALQLGDYPARLLQLLVILVIGFLLSSVGAIGAGDAKFAAAMAPFIARGDLQTFVFLFAAVLLAAVVTHRIFRRSPTIRQMAPDWESWTAKGFPMGFALGGTLVTYLILGAFYGA